MGVNMLSRDKDRRGGSQNSLLTPDYETIFVKGDSGAVDIERVLSQRQNLPKMGVNMLSRDKDSTAASQTGEPRGDNETEGSESSENSLPTTLEEFQKSTPVG